MPAEPDILNDLFSKWISLALEYAAGAADVRGVYVYASSERNSIFVNAYFDQAGTVVYPGKLAGIATSTVRIQQMQDLLRGDLFDAEAAFGEAGVPRPTEYRVFYDTATRSLDVQLSRDELYGPDTDRSPMRGIEYWLGERAPVLF
jgi:hypothetical protein